MNGGDFMKRTSFSSTLIGLVAILGMAGIAFQTRVNGDEALYVDSNVLSDNMSAQTYETVALQSDPIYGHSITVQLPRVCTPIIRGLAALIHKQHASLAHHRPIVMTDINAFTLQRLVSYVRAIYTLKREGKTPNDIFFALAQDIEEGCFGSEHESTPETPSVAQELLDLLIAADDLRISLLREALASVIARHLGIFGLHVNPQSREVVSPVDEWQLLSTDLIVRIVTYIPNLFLSERQIENAAQRFEGHIHKVYGCVQSHDGHHLLSASADRTARSWDTQSGKEQMVFSGHTRGVFAAVYTATNEKVLSVSADMTARLWNVSNGEELHVLTGHEGPVLAGLFTKDDKSAVTASADTTVRMWSAQSGRLRRVLTGHTKAVTHLILNHAGTHIFSGSLDGTVRIWEASSGKCVRILKGDAQGISSLAISHDDKHLAAGAFDGAIYLWDLANDSLFKKLELHAGSINSLCFSPIDKYLVSGCEDTLVSIWNAVEGKLLHTCTGHKKAVYSVACSPGGKYLVSGSGDRTVRVWNMKTGSLVRTLRGHTSRVSSVQYSVDGRSIISSSFDDTLRHWPLRYDIKFLMSGDIDWHRAWPNLVNRMFGAAEMDKTQ